MIQLLQHLLSGNNHPTPTAKAESHARQGDAPVTPFTIPEDGSSKMNGSEVDGKASFGHSLHDPSADGDSSHSEPTVASGAPNVRAEPENGISEDTQDAEGTAEHDSAVQEPPVVVQSVIAWMFGRTRGLEGATESAAQTAVEQPVQPITDTEKNGMGAEVKGVINQNRTPAVPHASIEQSNEAVGSLREQRREQPAALKGSHLSKPSSPQANTNTHQFVGAATAETFVPVAQAVQTQKVEGTARPAATDLPTSALPTTTNHLPPASQQVTVQYRPANLTTSDRAQLQASALHDSAGSEARVAQTIKPAIKGKDHPLPAIDARKTEAMAKKSPLVPTAVSTEQAVQVESAKRFEQVAAPAERSVVTDRVLGAASDRDLGVKSDLPADTSKLGSAKLAIPMAMSREGAADAPARLGNDQALKTHNETVPNEDAGRTRREAEPGRRMHVEGTQRREGENIAAAESASLQRKSRTNVTENINNNFLNADKEHLNDFNKKVGTGDAKSYAHMNESKPESGMPSMHLKSGMTHPTRDTLTATAQAATATAEGRSGNQSSSQGGHSNGQTSEHPGQQHHQAQTNAKELAGVSPASHMQQAFTGPSAYTSLQTEVIPAILQQIDRFRKFGKNNLRMKLELPGGERLTLQLRLDSDRVKVRFQTESDEMRDFLNDGWAGLAHQASKRGIQLTLPEFTKDLGADTAETEILTAEQVKQLG